MNDEQVGRAYGPIATYFVNRHFGILGYATMWFSGFLNIGEKYHSLPWKVSTDDPAMDGNAFDHENQLENMPACDTE